MLFHCKFFKLIVDFYRPLSLFLTRSKKQEQNKNVRGAEF